MKAQPAAAPLLFTLKEGDQGAGDPRAFSFDTMDTEKAVASPSSASDNPEAKPTIAQRTAKRRGEHAEAAFLSKATSLGFEVAKPWGDSAPFDFFLYTGPHTWRVQVKSARRNRKGRYTVKASGDKVRYTSKNIDFLVAYIVPENAWYVLPIAIVEPMAGLWFFPHPGSKSRFEPYREAWCLMACRRDGECNPEIAVPRQCQAEAAAELCPFACLPPPRPAKKRQARAPSPVEPGNLSGTNPSNHT